MRNEWGRAERWPRRDNSHSPGHLINTAASARCMDALTTGELFQQFISRSRDTSYGRQASWWAFCRSPATERVARKWPGVEAQRRPPVTSAQGLHPGAGARGAGGQFWHPSRVRQLPALDRGYRYAQPPATVWQPCGLRGAAEPQPGSGWPLLGRLSRPRLMDAIWRRGLTCGENHPFERNIE